ncbi:hypothetical protein BDM02DRAFT_3240307 [Thelephora ganbajun]|uniref:Uncharacterized protein n=1 Tax=Thelephora ganbajun TaxID=370292 RepID=A0ACB6ZFJ1_THEGA|nr:hypothetical protein BDM02DRAFT_3240307 [Thelephora ganbajun]
MILPGYESFATLFTDLLTTSPPPFVYIHDVATPHITSSVVSSVLVALPDKPPFLHAIVNASTCFTARLLYDTVIRKLADWTPTWESGCQLWGDQRWNENFDGFIHGLRAISVERSKSSTAKTRGQTTQSTPKMAIVIERAESLKEYLPDLLVPLSRLAESTKLNLTVVFISGYPWQDLRPLVGSAPDPLYVQPPELSKTDTIQLVVNHFPQDESNSHNPVFLPLYHQFLSTLYDVCSPFTKDPNELAYIAAARWPGFVTPILDEYRRLLDEARGDPGDEEEFELTAPTEDARIRLIRLFTPSFTTALEALYPRLSNADEWATDNKPQRNLLSSGFSGANIIDKSVPQTPQGSLTDVLPRMSKFILLAAFLASTNPTKSDIRMFGRAVHERKKRKRGIVASARGGTVKIPQRHLGPIIFPVDRVLAVLGILLEEYDADSRPPAPEYKLPGEYSDMEIRRVSTYSGITELTAMRLLRRVSPPERLDGPPMFKCAITYEVALRVAKDLGVPLNDLIFEPA